MGVLRCHAVERKSHIGFMQSGRLCVSGEAAAPELLDFYLVARFHCSFGETALACNLMHPGNLWRGGLLGIIVSLALRSVGWNVN